MTTFVAFLRGINVGKETMFPMKEIVAICEGLGLSNVRTYIQSGNILFASNQKESDLVALLERAFLEKKGKRIPVMIRTQSELESILTRNPFPGAEGAKVGVSLLAAPAPKDILADMKNPGTEEIVVSGREVFLFFPDGMGRTKLRTPTLTALGTVRNINTIGKLAALAGE